MTRRKDQTFHATGHPDDKQNKMNWLNNFKNQLVSSQPNMVHQNKSRYLKFMNISNWNHKQRVRLQESFDPGNKR